jgi:hypothetical protein
MLLLCCSSLLTLTACSRSFDASFANPCEYTLEIRTYLVPPDEISRERLAETARLAPLAVQDVEDAFGDAYGLRWAVAISDTDLRITVTKSEIDGDVVVFPAKVCNGP